MLEDSRVSNTYDHKMSDSMTSDRTRPGLLVTSKTWQQILSSGTGAIITSTIMTPLDVVKIRLQVQAKPMQSGQCFLYCNGLMDHVCTCLNGNTVVRPWYKRPGHFNGTLDAFVKIARNEGVTTLWSGLPPTLVMAVPATVLYYTTYDQLKDYFKLTFSSQWVFYAPVVSGGIARVVAATVISPLELIRTKMQSRPLKYAELVDCIRNSVAVDGVLSMWRGLGPTLLRDVPFSCIIWLNYEYLRQKICERYQVSDPSTYHAFLAAGLSGVVASVITQPFDVVKTQRQIELGDLDVMKKDRVKLVSTWDLLVNLHKSKGFSGMYAGLSPRLAKIAPACAIMISTYEYGKSFFKQRRGHSTEPT